MKKIFLVVFLFTLITSKAQKLAVTDTGQEVILYDDGTWKYKDKSDVEKEIPTNSKKFKKNDKSTFLLKSNKFNVGFWLNTKKWSFKKATNNEEAEYELQLKNGDLYGLMITEKTSIPLKTLKSIALENAKSVAPDITVVKEEYRTVNGSKVLLMQMNGTMQGIKVSYYGYYFSNNNGTLQFLTYTSQNLLSDYIDEIEDLLNGFIETK
ncbi:MAG: hypothetical protein CMP67_10155 [Flavobacteriales bacterium]|nr:hypothetical protein [Flavobacteriales bacterium]|tara:strand:- start:311 stop:937 length:627 start_codon:yes stop_codon:yes gene_type:complete